MNRMDRAGSTYVSPFRGIDLPWLVATSARTRRDHPFLIWDASFKVPAEVRFLPEFPRSTLEKIAKAELRKLLRD